MPTVPATVPPSTTTSSKSDGADYEPDDEWKLQLRKRIGESLQPMVANAKENYAAELRKSSDTPETRLHFEASCRQAVQNINGLAVKWYHLELDHERNQRRWAAGIPINPSWIQHFFEEKRNITNSIKQSSNQADNSPRAASKSRTNGRPYKPGNERPVPRHTPSLEEFPVQPAWRGWVAEEARKKRDEEGRREAARQEEGRWMDGMEPTELIAELQQAEFRKREEDIRRAREEGRREAARQEEGRWMDGMESTELIAELQQAEFRKREEDIRRAREERRRNGTDGNGNVRSNSSYLSASLGTPPGAPQFNGLPIPERSANRSIWDVGSASRPLHFSAFPGTGISRTPPQYDGTSIPERSVSAYIWSDELAPTRGPSIKPTTTPSLNANHSSASGSTRKPKTGPLRPGIYLSVAKRTREQFEAVRRQKEHFRRMEGMMEPERQLKSADRPPSLEELQRVFEHYDRLWNRLSTLSELSWTDFPWPMAKPPLSPDDMSLSLFGAYIQSPIYPDKDKPRTTRYRIREQFRRWHPDRFDTRLLPKVVESEKVKVKHGAGIIARYLGDLLMRERESNGDIFNLVAAQRENDPKRTKLVLSEAQTIVEDTLKIQEELKKIGDAHKKNLEMKDILSRREEFICKEGQGTKEKMKKYATRSDGRETELSYHGGNITVPDEHDSYSRDDDSFEDETETKRTGDLEAKMQRLEEDKRRTEDELNRVKVELQRLIDTVARRDEEKQKGEERKEGDARRREEDALKREEEMHRKEWEVKGREEAVAKKEERAKSMERDTEKREEAVKRKEAEIGRRVEELSRKEEEVMQRAVHLEEDTQRTKKLQLEVQNIAEDTLKKFEDVKKMEEEARRREVETREWAAQIEEETERRTKQMQLEAQRITEDALKKQDDLKKLEDSMRREVDSLRREKEAEKEVTIREEGAKAREGNTLVTGGAFNFAEGDIHINGSGTSPADKGIAKLILKVTSGAFHDSGELSDPLTMECHPNTRAAAIHEVFDWLDDLESPELVMWLHGATGAGKSAIAQTIAHVLSAQRQLSGSFFFARGSSTGRGDEKRLVPTLAYQLAKYYPETRVQIFKTVLKDPAIFDRTLLLQVQSLLLNPLWIASNVVPSSSNSLS